MKKNALTVQRIPAHAPTAGAVPSRYIHPLEEITVTRGLPRRLSVVHLHGIAAVVIGGTTIARRARTDDRADRAPERPAVR